MPNDQAFVVERAYIERELCRESKGKGRSSRDTMNRAAWKYWRSGVPYQDNYRLPQFAIWGEIDFKKDRVEETHRRGLATGFGQGMVT